MKLIKDLGMKPNKSGNRYRVGVFQCERCLESSERYFHNVKKNPDAMCSKCTKIVRNTTHGLSYDKCYNTWNSMVGRCLRKSSRQYHNYGGRGIEICDEWLDFPSFKKWYDENNIDGFQIDRIDNDGNYEPSNCQFISQQDNLAKKIVYKTSKYKYVHWNKNDCKWRAVYKGKYLGQFIDEEEAYDKIKEEIEKWEK